MSKGSEAVALAEHFGTQAANKAMRALGMEFLGRLMRKNPVDKGRSRANWNISVGAEDTSENPQATSADVARKQAEGLTRIAEIDFMKGDTMYATNAVPYIVELEHGHSKQAPQGFIRITGEELKGTAEQIARKATNGQ